MGARPQTEERQGHHMTTISGPHPPRPIGDGPPGLSIRHLSSGQACLSAGGVQSSVAAPSHRQGTAAGHGSIAAGGSRWG